MAETTTNIGLIKPESGDYITRVMFADNFKKIDEALENGGGAGIEIIISHQEPVSGATITASCGTEVKKVTATGTETRIKSRTMGSWTISENKYGTSASFEAPYFGQYFSKLGGEFVNLKIVYTEEFIGSTIILTNTEHEERQTFVATDELFVMAYSKWLGEWQIEVVYGEKEFTETTNIEKYGDTTFTISSDFLTVYVYTEDEDLQDVVVDIYSGKDNTGKHLNSILLVNGIASTIIHKSELELGEDEPSEDKPCYICGYVSEYKVWNCTKFEAINTTQIIELTTKEQYLYDVYSTSDKECSHITGNWKPGGETWTGSKNTVMTIPFKTNTANVDQRTDKTNNPAGYLQWKKATGWMGFSTTNKIDITKWKYLNVEITSNFLLPDDDDGEEITYLNPRFCCNVNEKNGKTYNQSVRRTPEKNSYVACIEINSELNDESFHLTLFGLNRGVYSFSRVWLSKEKPET